MTVRHSGKLVFVNPDVAEVSVMEDAKDRSMRRSAL
jgi:hypothetical protein